MQIKEEADKFGRSAGTRNTCARTSPACPPCAAPLKTPLGMYLVRFLQGLCFRIPGVIPSLWVTLAVPPDVRSSKSHLPGRRCTYGGAPKGPQLREHPVWACT